MGLTADPTPKFVGAITLAALLILVLIHRGFGGVSVSVGG
jgi:hypothetical protein